MKRGSRALRLLLLGASACGNNTSVIISLNRAQVPSLAAGEHLEMIAEGTSRPASQTYRRSFYLYPDQGVLGAEVLLPLASWETSASLWRITARGARCRVGVSAPQLTLYRPDLGSQQPNSSSVDLSVQCPSRCGLEYGMQQPPPSSDNCP